MDWTELGWQICVLLSIFIISKSIVCIFKTLSKQKRTLQKQAFEQSRELEELKQSNTLLLLKERNHEKITMKEIFGQLEELESSVINSSDNSKDKLDITNARLNLCEQLLKMQK